MCDALVDLILHPPVIKQEVMPCASM